MATVVLTGFLGAGKTTLLNRAIALRAAERGEGGDGGGKMGIIVNELGAIGVDGDLLPGGAARQVELPGGCVCCVMSDDLAKTVLEMLDGAPEIDTLVIETTGVAEPLPIVWALEEPPLGERLRVAAVVTVVDVLSFEGAREASVVAEIQVENADVVMISKADVGGGDVERVKGLVRGMAPQAPMVEGGVDERAEWLLGVLQDPEAGHGHGHGHGHDHQHDHDHGIEAVSMVVEGLVDLEELEEAIGELPRQYVRVKGIVWAVDPRLGAKVEPGWVAVHRVGTRVSSERVEKPVAGGRMVALGPGVTEAPLRDGVARAVVSCEPTT